MTTLFLAAAALCLALVTAETMRGGLTPSQALMLTALPWGLLTAGAIGSGLPLWGIGVAVVVVSAVTAGRVTLAGDPS
ncbi:hypothetical protein ACIRQH_34840 [Streptomyces sp. NPDC102279]|uniref:hypothetical protein n=1 Tax=Streptomyces sp. NPDC102279 TaxID=3366153 RepID=UPI0037F939C8